MSSVKSDVAVLLENYDRLLHSVDTAATISGLTSALNVELQRSIPSAYATDISQLGPKLAVVESKLRVQQRELSVYFQLLLLSSHSIHIAPICSATNRKAYSEIDELCRSKKPSQRTLLIKEFVARSSRVTDLISNEVATAVELRDALRRTQFLAMKNIIHLSNSALVTTLVDPAGTTLFGSYVDQRGLIACSAALMAEAKNQIAVAAKSNFVPTAKTRAKFVSVTEQLSKFLRERSACPVPPLSSACTQLRPNTREYYRRATASLLSVIRAELSSLEAASSNLSIDDWRIARNILLAKILAATDLNIRAIEADSVCT